YCATVQLSDYAAAGCPDPALNRKLLEHLGRNLSLGHWIELTRAVTALQKNRRFPAFMPEMVEFYFKPGKKQSLTPAAEIFEGLCKARNEWAHPSYTWPDEEARAKFREHNAPHLDPLIQALGFLARYTLYVP